MIESRMMSNHTPIMDPSAHQNNAEVQSPKKNYKDRRRSSIFSFLKKNKKLMRQNSAPVESLQNDLDAARLSSHLEYFRKMAMADSTLSIADDEPVVYRNGYARRYAGNGELEGVGLTDSDSEMSGGALRDAGAAPRGSELPQRRVSDALRQLRQMYVEDTVDEVGPSGELVEEMAEENKSLLWFLVKQVRPGMDLSKVVLPTFILEPRSFLDKLCDSYYHADILATAGRQDDAYQRFKTVLRWYLSGLYRKPRGLKKPYNPVLGELFRCYWWHPDTDTRTYYIAEQVSHHPPVSAFYISNRKDGFVIEGSLLARSKFYGNSTSALLEGCARVVLVNRARETYYTSAPFAHCKGLVVGTLSMELGGKVLVSCPNTGYSAEIDFKLKPFLGGSDQTNAISGRIRHNKDTVAAIEGFWDAKIEIRDKKTGEESQLLDCGVLRDHRMKRFLVRPDRQQQFESQRLWGDVSRAIAIEDQIAATEAKTIIEEGQRERARKAPEWQPTHFHRDLNLLQMEGFLDHGWRYNYVNLQPWSEAEIVEYEEDFVVKSLRADDVAVAASLPQLAPLAPLARQPPSDSDSQQEQDDTARRSKHYSRNMKKTLNSIDVTLREQSQSLDRLRAAVEALSAERRPPSRNHSGPTVSRSPSWDLISGFALAMIMQAVLNWIFFK